MKILCENMLHPTKNNWKDLLYIATTLDLQRTKLEILVYLRDNFDILISFDHEIFTQLNTEYPELLSTILIMRCKSFPTPPSFKFIKHIETTKQQDIKDKANLKIPWVALGVVIVGAYGYSHAVRIVSVGPLIPVVNSLFMIGLLYYAYSVAFDHWKK